MFNKILTLGYISYIIVNKKDYENVNIGNEIVNLNNIKNKVIATEKFDDKMNIIINKDTAKSVNNIAATFIVKSYNMVMDLCKK